ncbi:MAG TPA: cytosine deaminase [Bacillota bacterium]|nr:cytosine deaminase [Bacillota bacterium]
MDLIIRQAKLIDQEPFVDIAIKDGYFVKIAENITDLTKKEIHANGKLVSPPFVESHIHLDSALTVGQPRHNSSGTLLEGIQIWSDYKETISKQAIKENAKKTLFWLMANGVLHVRTHIDTTEPQLLTMKALLEVKQELTDMIDLQIVAFPQDGIFAFNGMDRLLEDALEMGADVIGGIPQVELTREDGIKQIEYIFNLAKKHHKMIDIHTDETTDEQSRFAEVIAKYAIKFGMENQVTASHTTALHNYNNDYAQKLIGNLKRSGVNIVTNPFSNAMLQNRLDHYPKHRGTTRVDELLKNGINVSIGNDNIMDPFNPLGKGNLLQAAHLLAHTAHLSSQTELRKLFQMITVNGAQTLNIENYGINVGNQADCITLDAYDEVEAIRLTSECLYVIRHGQIIAETTPATSKLHLADHTFPVDFKFRRE